MSCWHNEAMKRAAGFVVAAVFVVASCGGSDDTEASVPESVDAAPLDEELEEFCDFFSEMLDDTEESYVGSAEHIEDVATLLAVAPPDVVVDLTVFSDYLRTGAIDSIADPDSTLTSNWPPEVRDAAQRAVDYGFTVC